MCFRLRFEFLIKINYSYFLQEEPHITDFGITGFPEGYPMSRLDKLEIFELLTDTDGITDTSVRHIEGMKSLKQVKIGQLFSKSYFQ